MRFLGYLATATVALLCVGCAAIQTFVNNGARLGIGALAGLLIFFIAPVTGAAALVLAGISGALASILAEPRLGPVKQGAAPGMVSVASSILWVAAFVFILLWVFGHHVNPFRVLGWIRRIAARVRRMADVTERK